MLNDHDNASQNSQTRYRSIDLYVIKCTTNS